jgi:hypothetical protein
VGLERGPLNLVSKTEELVGRKSSSSGLESFRTSENETHVQVSFLAGNDLTNKILKYWHEVTPFSVYSSYHHNWIY